jgi:hypothetical protein
LLEWQIARRASKFSICRRKEEGFISLRSEEQKSSEGVALCVKRLCRGVEVAKSLEDSKDKLRRSSSFGTRSHSYKCRSERTLWESS